MAARVVLSGNNFVKVQLLAKHVGMGMVNKLMYQRIQNKWHAGELMN